MKDAEKSISELMDMMKADSDEFFGKVPKAEPPSYTVGASGRREWNEQESPEDMQCRLEALNEFIEDEAMLAQPRVDFPDQGHKVRGGYKEGTGEITVEVTPQTEWGENS